MRSALLLVALLACNTPAPSLRLALAGPPAQACPSTDCLEIPMSCATIMSIRIIDPADPSAPFLSQCTEVPQDRKKDLCSLAVVELDKKALPIKTLEVQVAIYPRDAVTDPATGAVTCPADVKYDATKGFPVEQPNAPALGGRAFYHPGDEEIVVTLGCTDVMALNAAACLGANNTKITSTVLDFDTRIAASPALGDRLSVAVGEPHELNGAFVLNPADARQLDRTVSGPIPAWGGDVDLSFTTGACAEVLEDGAQATTTLTCKKDITPIDHQLDVPGTRLARTSLSQILNALQLPVFPDPGLTVGILVDYQNIPVPGFVVQATTGSVEYLSADRSTTVAGATTSNGIFVSTDAPYGTIFTSSGLGKNLEEPGLGGRVEGKVTIVILRFEKPPVR